MTLELSTPLIWIDDWPDAVVDSDTWNQHLKKSKHWDDKTAMVFIFDEAQLAYADKDLWDTIFKITSDYCHPHPSHYPFYEPWKSNKNQRSSYSYVYQATANGDLGSY